MKLVLIGGFLGSGKTTAITAAARDLIQKGKKVAIITNDQGNQQVDSAYLQSMDLSVREVSNGCFCCNYQQLDEHIEELKLNAPDIIFAESVGTCTDLIATIAKPMYKLRPETEIVICIFADAALVSSIIEGRSTFAEESVRYIYKKQLEEADILVLNKIDLVTSQRKTVDAILQTEYPDKIILHQNSFDEHDVSRWIEKIYAFTSGERRQSLNIDYNIYGDGEGQLAWLDKTIYLETEDQGAVFVVQGLIRSIADNIQAGNFAIGHLKFFIEAGTFKEKISITSTSTGSDVKLRRCESLQATVLINARVETTPLLLETIVDTAVAQTEARYNCKFKSGKWSVFKPGFPRPTHRVVL
jgi:Ni2+-binding GTPase involved in maturation of urease and hydrogenase